MSMKIVTVARDADGDLWVRTGVDRWTALADLPSEVTRERWSCTLEELNSNYGPIDAHVVMDIEREEGWS
jgi:hypothetical protein